MALDPIHAFYCSKDYLDLSIALKIKSDGRCAICGKIFPISSLRTHHITELNTENVNNPQITLNPNNIMVICHDCHNKEHRRFVVKQKSVYVVWGPPCSGKSSYVQQVATRYDLIVDLDKIHQAISNCSLYDKPYATKGLAFSIRDLLWDKIKVRQGDWENAYIVGTFPHRYERDEFANNYGAELIHMDVTKQDCIRRLMLSEERQAVKDQVINWINKYFEEVRH